MTRAIHGSARLWAIVAALVVCAGTEAAAQLPPENGVKMGAGRLHPYFDFEARADSAAGYFPASATAGDDGIAPEVINHLRPGFRLEVPSSAIELSLNGNLDYVWYTGLLSSNSNRASRLEAGADLAAIFNKEGVVGFELGDRFSYTDRTTNPAIAIGVLSLFNEVYARLPVRPGGGALELTPGGAFAVEFFSPIVSAGIPGCTLVVCDPNRVATFNYANLRGELEARYKFLPKTALLLDGTYDVRTAFSGGTLPSQLLKVQGGLAGLVSPKIALLVKAGYARDFAGAARTVVGHGELTYFITERSNVKFGYLRSIEPVPVFGSFGDDRGYLETSLAAGERFRFSGYAAFDYLTYYGTEPRHDTNVTLTLSPEYSFTRWFKGALAYTLAVRNSDQSSAVTLNFTRHEGLVRATFQY